MKESKNLKGTKSNILVGLYLDKIRHEGQLSECLFGLANQTKSIDVVVLDGGMSDSEIETLMRLAAEPSIRKQIQNEDGTIEDEVVKANGISGLSVVKVGVSNFPKFFNTLTGLAIEGEYEAFSVIEVDDFVGPNWYSIADVYMKENDDVSFFLPMMRNFQNGALQGLLNEACWAEGISEEAGKFDVPLLTRMNCANPLAGVYKISALEEFSENIDGKLFPMKESMKISHYYEFFLRMIYNDVKVMTVPRVGYDFRVGSVDEFSQSSSKIPNNLISIPAEKGGISAGEFSFWLDLAKKEYFFDEDRKKTYEQSAG